jgi:predicted nucleotidyltransferase
MAFLSFRLPVETRDRVKAAAARRGQSVQELLGGLVDDLLRVEGREPPSLSDVLRRLRRENAQLRQQGVAKLWLFGSIVRGEARAGSDIDIIAEFDPAARVSLTAVARLRQDLAEILGMPVDLAEWRTLRPAVRRTAEQDAVLVF